jgi:hypothetical protein
MSEPMHYGVMYPDGGVGRLAVGVPVSFDRWRQLLADGSSGHYPPGTKLVQRVGYDGPWEDVDPAVFSDVLADGSPALDTAIGGSADREYFANLRKRIQDRAES